MIHLIVGNTGSGKTTYAKELKKQNNGIVFSIDEWNKTLFLADKKDTDGLNWFLERIDRAEKLISNFILQLEKSNVDSILDLGLSKVSHREKFREFAKKHKIEICLHFLDIPKETRLKRVFKRNNEKGETYQFNVSQEDFDFMGNWFEKPAEVELKNGIIITS